MVKNLCSSYVPPTGACSQFGLSCFGAHGKRNGSPMPLNFVLPVRTSLDDNLDADMDEESFPSPVVNPDKRSWINSLTANNVQSEFENIQSQPNSVNRKHLGYVQDFDFAHHKNRAQNLYRKYFKRNTNFAPKNAKTLQYTPDLDEATSESSPQDFVMTKDIIEDFRNWVIYLATWLVS